jgi:CBS domain-containing protein
MDDLLKIAKRPAVVTSSDTTVRTLCENMLAERVGAMAVVDGGKLVGIVSERDVVVRVVVERKDPGTTRVGDIMTSSVVTVREGTTLNDALRKMDEGRFRHLPLVDGDGKVIGMLSIRHLLSSRVAELDLHNVDLQNFIAADGPGG